MDVEDIWILVSTGRTHDKETHVSYSLAQLHEHIIQFASCGIDLGVRWLRQAF